MLDVENLEELTREDPTQTLVFVIGDSEGRLDLLDKMITMIESYTLAKNDKIVLTGNQIGKGTKTKDLIQYLFGYSKKRPNFQMLRGMTEHRFIKSRHNFFESSLGMDVINSYREPDGSIDVFTYISDREWLDLNPIFVETSKFFISPAGLQPTKTLENQTLGELMFIELQTFYQNTKDFGKKIIHGSFGLNNNKVDITANRINVNTSPATTGVLSCVVLNDVTGEIKEVLRVADSTLDLVA